MKKKYKKVKKNLVIKKKAVPLHRNQQPNKDETDSNRQRRTS